MRALARVGRQIVCAAAEKIAEDRTGGRVQKHEQEQIAERKQTEQSKAKQNQDRQGIATFRSDSNSCERTHL